MKHKTEDQKRMSFKAMAELVGIPYRTAHFRWSKGYTLADSLLVAVGEPKRSSQVKHGMHDSSEYAAWERMHQRCRSHPHYLRLGIRVCERWGEFTAFLSDMGPMPPGMSLDRLRGAESYSPDNCRWATPQQQSRNTSRNIKVERGGVVDCVAEWAGGAAVSARTVYERIHRGWSIDQAVETPRYGSPQ